MKKILAIGALALILNSCSNSGNTENKEGAQTQTTLKIDGSSTVYPISEAVAEDYKAVNANLQITIAESGTGGGMKKFSAGDIEICNASRPIKKEEADACAVKGIKFIELPIAYDGLAVVVNPKNTWANHLTTAELKTIWESAAQGKITSWDQVRKGFPKKSISLFGPGTDSGTFDYFAEAINNKKGDSRGDYTASEDDNTLVQGVAADVGALGYFGLAYFEENKDKLKLVAIDDENDANGKGAILPTLETVQNGTYAPLSRVLLIYINATALDNKEINDFATYYVNNASKLSAEVGYVSLQNDLYTIVLDRLSKKTEGSIYTDGQEVGTTLEVKLKGTTVQ
ncbi:MAG: PstS family phosphate ABC transporter substrate-binding protein [Chitinophagales bacterium]|nr:PstS family phosphate ABC transporter substrate-binding protein [Chitinophagales bacterium]